MLIYTFRQWEAYTLGKAPTNSDTGADLTVTDQNAHAAGLELVRNAGSHYLVQRWGDGTICDKTGKSREVEVQVRNLRYRSHTKS